MIELMACPFCGKNAAEIKTAHDLEECGNWEDDVCPCVAAESADYCGAYIVVCNMEKGGCGASSCYCSSPGQAAEAWNRREPKRYAAHEVATILAELFRDDCACNYNDNDEWLPEYCEFSETVCPNTTGVACWEQYLKWREKKGEKDARD